MHCFEFNTNYIKNFSVQSTGSSFHYLCNESTLNSMSLLTATWICPCYCKPKLLYVFTSKAKEPIPSAQISKFRIHFPLSHSSSANLGLERERSSAGGSCSARLAHLNLHTPIIVTGVLAAPPFLFSVSVRCCCCCCCCLFPGQFLRRPSPR